MAKSNVRTGGASAAPFSHLLSFVRGGRSAARAESEETEEESEEDRDARRAEEDQRREEEDARRAEEDERRRDEDARRAEEDEVDPEDPEDPGDPEAEEQPEDEKSKKGKRAKKAKKADDEDQDPEADAGDDDDSCEEPEDEKEKEAFRRGLALGRARENLRASRIFQSPAAAGRADLAATLAFTTRNSSAEAGRLMAAAAQAPQRRGRSLDDRMGARTDARPGADGGRTANLADQIIAAGKKRRGES